MVVGVLVDTLQPSNEVRDEWSAKPRIEDDEQNGGKIRSDVDDEELSGHRQTSLEGVKMRRAGLILAAVALLSVSADRAPKVGPEELLSTDWTLGGNPPAVFRFGQDGKIRHSSSVRGSWSFRGGKLAIAWAALKPAEYEVRMVPVLVPKNGGSVLFPNEVGKRVRPTVDGE